MFGLQDDVRAAMRVACEAREVAALVTLHTVCGGGPRPPGAQMLLSRNVAAGFLSGGCVESDVALHAAKTLEDGQPRQLVYGRGSPWPDIQLSCGARIEVLVERLLPENPALTALLARTRARQDVVWTSDGRSQAVECVSASGEACEVHASPFLMKRYYHPTLRLVVIGADPIALAVASLAAQTGLESILVRPKGPELGPPLPGVGYSRLDPSEALQSIKIDRWTAIAVATHDWSVGQEALMAALPSEAPYVGLLGARWRLAERLAQLCDGGITEAMLEKLRAPIGLDLGGKAPWEIAVAVIGQIIAEWSRRPLRPAVHPADQRNQRPAPGHAHHYEIG